MQHIPPLDTTKHGLQTLLDARKITVDWFNHEDRDRDPFNPNNVARFTFWQTVKQIPFIYQQAVPDAAEVDTWINRLVRTAQNTQGESPVATVKRGPSLLLLGPTGVGKTHQAYGAMRALAVTGVSATWRVTTAADLYAALRPRPGIDSETEFRGYREAHILLIDDLGAAKSSEFVEDINFRLINHRYEHHLPTLLTSNVTPKELSSRLGDRVASRLVEMCQQVVITGRDRRRGGEAA